MFVGRPTCLRHVFVGHVWLGILQACGYCGSFSFLPPIPVFGVPFCIDDVVAGRLKLWWCYVLPLAQAKPLCYSQRIMMAVEQVQASCQSSLALYSICFKCMFCVKELSPCEGEWPHPTKWRWGGVNVACVIGTLSLDVQNDAEGSFPRLCDVACMLDMMLLGLSSDNWDLCSERFKCVRYMRSVGIAIATDCFFACVYAYELAQWCGKICCN